VRGVDWDGWVLDGADRVRLAADPIRGKAANWLET
jgi:hypothetical protein